MDNNIKAAIYIALGVVLFLAVFDLIFKLMLLLLGLYFIYKGLEFRGSNNILFYIHRFKNRF